MPSPVMYAEIVREREAKKKKVVDAQALYRRHVDEKRDMSADEKEKFDALADQVAGHESRIKTLEKLGDTEEEAETDDEDREDDDTESKDEDRERGAGKKGEKRSNSERRANNADSRDNPSRGGRGEHRNRLTRRIGETEQAFKNRERRSKPEYINAVMDYICHGNAALHSATHQRALQADLDIVGGYLVLPEKISNKILKKVQDILWLRQFATITRLEGAQSLGQPTLDNDPDDGDWTTEIASITADTSMSFGKRSLTPTPIRKRILVSEKFLRMAMSATFQSSDDEDGQGGSPENIIINRLAYKIAKTQETAFFLGNGVGQPLGLFTASTRGISTGRDVQTGSSTNITYNGLVSAKYTLKVQYHPSARWMVSRKFMENTMKLVDDNNRPLLNISTLPNQPDTLLQVPLTISELVPNAFTTGTYVAIIGDYSYYQIVDALDITVKQAQELYLETSQVGFFVAAECDGMPVLEEAFVRLITN